MAIFQANLGLQVPLDTTNAPYFLINTMSSDRRRNSDEVMEGVEGRYKICIFIVNVGLNLLLVVCLFVCCCKTLIST